MKKLFVLVGLFVLCLNPFASAQGLTQKDMETVAKLGDVAVKHSSVLIAAKRDLEATRQSESVTGRVLSGLNLNVGAGAGDSLPFDQVQPSYKFSVSLNLTPLVSTPPTQLPALEAKIAELDRQVRLEVLRCYTVWKLAIARAHKAAEDVDVRNAEYKATEARVKGGTSTQTDLLRAWNAAQASDLALEEANTAIVIAKFDLARMVGVTVTELVPLLK
jgi:hypothetical protein